MTPPTPRQRAAQAFAVIDRHHDAYGHSGPYDLPRLAVAYTQLAHAMDDIWGPLPERTLLAEYGDARRAEASEGPRR